MARILQLRLWFLSVFSAFIRAPFFSGTSLQFNAPRQVLVVGENFFESES